MVPCLREIREISEKVTNMNNKVELLSPAGSYEGMVAAFDAGADAVYLGGQKFGARAYAGNFSSEELLQAIDYAHLRDKKLYLTVNTLLKEREMTEELAPYLDPLYLQGLDGVIVQDLGIVSFLRRRYPELPVHASTQMTVTSLEGVEFLKTLGITRVVTARELSLDEVAYITGNTEVEIESFVHGAICYCYSGQCLFSSMLGGRSGNRGRCAQPCRLPYVNEKGKKAYFLSLKDMCTLPILPELVRSGIRSLKIEGRMKSPEYTAGVTAIYRKYLDQVENEIGRKNPDRPKFQVDPKDLEALTKLYSRSGSDTGYYHQRNGRQMLTLSKPCYERDLSAADEQVMRQKSGDKGDAGNIRGTSSGKKLLLGEVCLKVGEPTVMWVVPCDETGKPATEKMASCDETGKPAMGLRSEWICVEGEVVSEAVKQPLSSEQVESRMRKTGGTAYEFRSLKISVGENCYVSVKGLNELRRSALEALETSVLRKYRRAAIRESAVEEFVLEGIPLGEISVGGSISGKSLSEGVGFGEKLESERLPFTSVLVTTADQLEAVLNSRMSLSLPPIHRLYLERNIWNFLLKGDLEKRLLGSHSQKDSGEVEHLQIILALPHILRRDNVTSLKKDLAEVLDLADGVLLRNLEEMEILRRMHYQGKVLIDANLYTWNKEARGFWMNQGIAGDTAPLELNRDELWDRGLEGSEIIVYGYVPLMTTAQCVQKTMDGCLMDRGRNVQVYSSNLNIRYLTDRYQVSFPVMNRCKECYNQIFNSVPISLLKNKDLESLRKMKPASYRLQFTIEPGNEVEQVLKGLKLENTTKGHFSRGVE